MITLNKKQVKGILDILKSEYNATRPALQTIRIKRDGYMYMTDGYAAIRAKLETEPVPTDDDQEEFVITLENLERWYKLAKPKDELNEITICDLQDTYNDTLFPDMAALYKQYLDKPKVKLESAVFDVSKLKTIMAVVGTDYTKIEFYGDESQYIINIKGDEFDAILMPLTK